MITEVTFEEIKSISFWVVPDAGSFTLGLVTSSGKEFDILITQAVDLEDYDEDTIPGRIYIDKQLIGLKSKEEAIILSVLSDLLKNDQLGHKEGLAAFRAKEIIHFFISDEAEKVNRLLNNKQ